MKRFFSLDSFWNTPVGLNPEIDPDSDHYINLLKGEDGGPFWLNISNYTIPVYEAKPDTPRHTVHQMECDTERMKKSRWHDRKTWFRQSPGFGKNIPIPDHAIPDPADDQHMAIVDWEQDMIWDTWKCRKTDDNKWESYTGMVYPAGNSGVWKIEDFAAEDGDSIHFYGPSRAAGVPAVAGLIMYEEILAGKIEHKLAFATWHNALKKFIYPATWTDGWGS